MPSHRSPLSALRRGVFTLVVASTLSACTETTVVSGPSATPTAIRASNGNQQSAVVGVALTTPLSVVVTDKTGKVVTGARVQWDAAALAGSVSPSVTTSDSRGVATTSWTIGTVAGTARVTAMIPGLNPVVFSATAVVGAAATVVALPEAINLAVGDSARVRATLRDQYGNTIGGQPITITSLDLGVATVSVNGFVTAVSAGNARVVAASAGRADTVPVVVGPAGSSVCGGAANRTLALGEVFIPEAGASGVSTCLRGPATASGEYAIAIISTAPAYSTVTALDVVALGNAGPITTPIVGATTASGTAVDADITTPSAGDGVVTMLDVSARSADPVRAAELARRKTERRELAPLVNDAREWLAETAVAHSVQSVAEAKVGDILRLNANASVGCSNADTRIARVAAVGLRAIVIADTANPSGGYTDSEYASILATFDTLAYPVDTAAFGAPSNISQYGKIILFYTRNVNALTPPAANYTIGGFFFARDLYPKTARGKLQGCAASNEQEMFYLLVPDPLGTVNGNRRTKDQVTLLNLGTIAHEFAHLINASRRLYVTPNASPSEETWLDEGLAHVAEELLFFRMSGYSSRQNLLLADVNRQATNFANYASQNFARYYAFLVNPELNSPYAPNDSLTTRGAIWSFLRYSAGRQGEGGDAAFFRALVNSPLTGFANLNSATGGRIGDYLRDWAVAVIADDYSVAQTALLAPQYTFPSWNFRNVYPGLRFAGGSALGVYPVSARLLTNNTPQRVALVGGASSYVRFSIATGRDALLHITANGGAVPSTLRYSIVRLR
ncbi:MAG: Ig-like domain-containing protein [Gemmatimonadota bacterium]